MPTEQPEPPTPQPLKKSISPLFDALITCQPDATQAKREKILEQIKNQCSYNGYAVPEGLSDIANMDLYKLVICLSCSREMAELIGVNRPEISEALRVMLNARDSIQSAIATPMSQTKECMATILAASRLKHSNIDITNPFEDNGIEIVSSPINEGVSLDELFAEGRERDDREDDGE